jgi:hypothetical protein
LIGVKIKSLPYNSKEHDYNNITTNDNNTDNCKARIIPINQLRNVPLDSVTRYDNDRLRKSESQRHYTAAKVINDLAVKKYKINGRGTNFNDLLFAKIATSKKQAQIKLKYHLKKKTLFTISKNKPQSYYPESLRSEIINNKISKNIPIGITGVLYNNDTHFLTYDTVVIRSLEDYVLPLLPHVPLGIHKLELMLKINSLYYQDINTTYNRWNRGREHEEIIGHTLAKYRFYPNGTIMVFVQSNNIPLKLETEDDLVYVIAFLGQLRDRLIIFLNDKHERVVPDIMQWELKQCDINRDVKVGEWVQYTGLKIQIKHACHLFRVYIKSKGEYTICRVEESVSNNNNNNNNKKPAVTTINEIFNPHEKVEKRLEEIHQAIQMLSTQLHTFDERLGKKLKDSRITPRCQKDLRTRASSRCTLSEVRSQGMMNDCSLVQRGVP